LRPGRRPGIIAPMPKASRRSPVTPAEYLVMRALWDLGAGTVAAIHAAIPGRRALAYNTVLTQVRLLHAKGWVAREAVGRAHVYRPRHDREAVLRAVLRQLVESYFDGRPAALAAFLGETGFLEAPARRGAQAATSAEPEGDGLAGERADGSADESPAAS